MGADTWTCVQKTRQYDKIREPATDMNLLRISSSVDDGGGDTSERISYFICAENISAIIFAKAYKSIKNDLVIELP